MADLFKEGMGVAAPKNNEVGLIRPKLGFMAQPGSQKEFNRKRDQTMRDGTFKLAYTDSEMKADLPNSDSKTSFFLNHSK